MIFVTVGTHEQPFNRLIKEVDRLVADGKIKEKVVIQTGFSTYIPEHCEWHKMMSFNEMQTAYQTARIIITHGGPSSFLEALQYGKVPIVVPRQVEFNEHINNHQVDFVNLIAERMNNIIPVYQIDDLAVKIFNYDNFVKIKNSSKTSNNKKFNADLEKIVERLVK
ncbi:glycosyltransferase [Limosilactobacillus mucosae]|uniref:glycosyltransferase n=1 Tax=Limosilactobacillus mucosae TaxID=97478 RepID=UPI003994357F